MAKRVISGMNKNEKSEVFGPDPFALEYLLITKVFL